MRSLILLTAALAASSALRSEESTVKRETHVYDIRFLTDEVPHSEASGWPSAGELFLIDEIAESSEPISFGGEAPESEERAVDLAQTLGGGVRIDPRQLSELIQKNVSEDSWANSRNSIRIGKGRLVVTQTAEVHEQIAALVQRLSARRSTMLSVAVTVVPADLVALSKPFLSDAELQRVVERAGARAERVVMTAYNEQLIGSFRGGRRSVQLGDTVNQTGVVPVSNPLVATLESGRAIEVAPLAIAGTEWARVSLSLTRVKESGKPSPVTTPSGEIRHVQATEIAISTTLLLKPGTVALAGSFAESASSAAPRRFAVLCGLQTVRLREERAAAKVAPDAFFLRAYDLGFLTGALPGDAQTMEVETIARLLPRLAPSDDWQDERSSIDAAPDGRFLTIVARREAHEAVARWLEKEVARRGRVSSIVVEELSGQLASLLKLTGDSDDGVYLRDGWRERLTDLKISTRFRARTHSVLGARSEARAIEARTFSADAQMISGGSGFAIVERAEPTQSSAGSGFILGALTREALDPGSLFVDLSLRRAQLDLSRSAEFLFRVHGPGQARASGAGAVSSRGSSFRFPIALPAQRASEQRFRATLRRGRPAVIHIEDEGGGRGRLLVVEAAVHAALAGGE